MCYHSALHYGNAKNVRSADGKQIFTVQMGKLPASHSSALLIVYTHSRSINHREYSSGSIVIE